MLSHSFWHCTIEGKSLSPEACVDMVCTDTVEVLGLTQSSTAADLRARPDLSPTVSGNTRFCNITANSILALLGGWLFEAALNKHAQADADESRALAVASIGRIFASKYTTGNNGQLHAALPHHRSRYFLCLKYAFDTGRPGFSKKVLATALLTSWRVMSVPMQGSELLMDSCLAAINEIVSASGAG